MKPILAVPATLALCYRAYSHKSLTPLGIFTAALTAAAHAVHPWNLPFVLLVVFFLAGTRVTKVKKEVKERLTIHASGGSGAHGGEGPRTHVQGWFPLCFFYVGGRREGMGRQESKC
jgi:uncharacterized membrane protein